MPAFIVRKALTGQAAQGGALGANAVMIHAASLEQARVRGAAKLGVNDLAVTVDPYENDLSHLLVQTKEGHEFNPDDVEVVQPALGGGKFESMTD